MKTTFVRTLTAVAVSLVLPAFVQAATEDVTVVSVGDNGLAVLAAAGNLQLVVPAKKHWLTRGLAKGDKITVTYEQDGEKKILTETRGSGTVVGTATRIEETHITVEADDGVTHRLAPGWVGGMPNEGGGFNKDVLAQIHAIAKGQRVRLTWSINEGKRVDSVTALKTSPE